MSMEQKVISGLKKAYEHFCNGDGQQYVYEMDQAKELIHRMDEGEDKQDFMGEYILLTSLPQARWPQQLIPIYEQAIQYKNGRRSKVIGVSEPMWLYFGDLPTFYLTEVGKAEQIGRDLAKAAKLYEQLTGGGQFTYETYLLSLYYYQGNLHESEKLCYTVIYSGGAAKQ